jgi:LysM repeat protein
MSRISIFQKVFWALVLLIASAAIVHAQDSTTYTIKYGDVLDVIAASYDVSVDCLAEASDIADPNQIRPGDTLVISSACPPYDGLAFVPSPREATEGQGGGGPSLSNGDVSYTVRRGDVLDLIAASFDVSAKCIADESELADPNRINIGDELKISASCPPYDGEAFVPNPRNSAETSTDAGQGGGSTVSAGGDNSYVVQTGDVLDLIAASFDVSVQCTAEASGLTDPNRISPGDVIVIDLSCPRYDGDAFVPNPRGGEASSG